LGYSEGFYNNVLFIVQLSKDVEQLKARDALHNLTAEATDDALLRASVSLLKMAITSGQFWGLWFLVLLTYTPPSIPLPVLLSPFKMLFGLGPPP
jgi:hypothetical protein